MTRGLALKEVGEGRYICYNGVRISELRVSEAAVLQSQHPLYLHKYATILPIWSVNYF